MNLDTLYEIAIKLDEEALVSLFVTLQLTAEQAKSILSNMYWYRRTEYLVRRDLDQQLDVDWKQIYYEMKRIVSVERIPLASEQLVEDIAQLPKSILSPIYWSGLEHSVGLLHVLIEVYGEPTLHNKPGDSNIDKIRSSEVLRYCIEQGYLTYDILTAYVHLVGSLIRSNWHTIVPEIVKYADPNKFALSNKQYLLKPEHDPAAFKFMYHWIKPDHDLMMKIVLGAVRYSHPNKNRVAVLNFLLSSRSDLT